MNQPHWFEHGWPHIWHPYCQMKTAPKPLVVERTEGCSIYLEDGRKLTDGISSWWSAAHGYNHPYLLEAAKDQLEKMPHVMFGGLAHEQAYNLAARLCKITPGRGDKTEGLTRVFFSDSGSTAVEVALKMALQYWANLGKPRKNRFICLNDGYHGDTFGAMAVSDPERGLHKAYRNNIIMHFALEIPSGEYSFAEFEETIAAIASSSAGLIIEPLVQGAGGMKMHSPDILAAIHSLCKKHDILFIADEIMTGFCRTGTRFACEEAGIVPDILCLGKALTGGVMGLAATLTRESVFESFYDDDPAKALMHGPTYMANPLACAVANASLDLFENEPRLAQTQFIEETLHRELSPLRELSGVVDVRVKGAIGAVQLASEFVDLYALREAFLPYNVWVRPFQDVVYLMPPLVISGEELRQLTNAVKEIVFHWSREVRGKVSHLFDGYSA